MTTGRTAKPAGAAQPKPVNPLPDPPPMPDGMPQLPHISGADQTLKTWFRRREDVLVGGGGYLCPDRRNVRRCPVPDLLVAFGVDPEHITETRGYVISEVGKPPDFVLEVASTTTWRRDYGEKRSIYAGMGVGEYWRFDYTGARYHPAGELALAGDRLEDGEFKPLPVSAAPDGELRGYSPALQLYLCWKDRQLRFYDPETAAYLLTQPELEDRLAAVKSRQEAQRAASRADLIAAEAQRDLALTELDATQAERTRIESEHAAALEEIERLRELLRRRDEEEPNAETQ